MSLKKVSKFTLIKLLILALLINVPFIDSTNAYFFDRDTVEENTLTTGWWIDPEVEVLSPNGGETYVVGDKVEITWKAESSDPDNDHLHIRILKSTDSGGHYTELVSGLADVTSWTWLVEDKSSTMRIKVEVTDEHGLTGSDSSDADFCPVESEDEDKDDDKDDKKEDAVKKEEITETPESTPSADEPLIVVEEEQQIAEEQESVIFEEPEEEIVPEEVVVEEESPEPEPEPEPEQESPVEEEEDIVVEQEAEENVVQEG